jgi:hypothetical protein
VREDLRVDAVLERRDDVAAAGVVLGVRAEDEDDVHRDAHREAADLQVALLEDVQQRHLDARREVGQLVDGEDAAVRARDDAVVDDLFVGVGQALVRGLDRIDVADEVRDGDVGRGEFFAISLLAVQPRDGQIVAFLRGETPAALARRLQRRVVDLASFDDRNALVEQQRERAENARLGLPAQSQKNDVVLGEDGVVDGRDDGALVAVDAGEGRFAPRDHGQEVLAHFIFDGADGIAGGAELAEGVDRVH